MLRSCHRCGCDGALISVVQQTELLQPQAQFRAIPGTYSTLHPARAVNHRFLAEPLNPEPLNPKGLGFRV